MDKRIGKGRQKIEMKLIESKEARTVTFSKRKKGLFKKVDEYSDRSRCWCFTLFTKWKTILLWLYKYRKNN
ncbi:hypothetical protein RDI58_021821 [Solanum bulbocastanum]|uniref:MADS-box domain-containing protein n=1 Tax=Solanum bulbocastanum TaxID=147425 RepID=A0AAN8Y593_SOLBU